MKTSATYFQVKYIPVLLVFFTFWFPGITNAQSDMAYINAMHGVVGFPTYQLNTGYIGGSVGSVSAYVELEVNFAGNLATVNMGSLGTLSGSGSVKKLSFQGTSGFANMDFGPSILVKYNVTIPKATGPFSGNFVGQPNIGLEVSDTKDFTTLLLDTVVELSDTLPSLSVSEDSIYIGLTVGGKKVYAHFDLDMDEELKNTIQGTSLSTSAGSISSESDTLSVPVSGSTLIVSGIKESLKSKLSLTVGVTGRIGVYYAGSDFGIGIPKIKFPVNIGTLSFTTDPPESAIFSGITNVENYHSSLPKFYSLAQNYPNPFNPTTIINYSIPKTSKVVLHVYNTLGQMIKTLVNTTEAPGNYNVTFNGTNLPSGIYFYHIQAGGYSAIKKLVLLK